MLTEKMNLVNQKIEDADMVLVAVGDEFDGEELLSSNLDYAKHCETLSKNHLEWVVPYLNQYYLSKTDIVKNALNGLQKCLDGKNYFVLSCSMSGLIENSLLNKERIVAICGSIHENVYDNKPEINEKVFSVIEDCIRKQCDWEKLSQRIQEMVPDGFEFNTLYSEKFTEEKHKDKWNTYLKWLQGTLNRKICILELGVGLRYLNVIRLRFEKICEMNQKAFLIRVHKNFYQSASQIADKSLSISSNSLDFMEKWNEVW